jgi:ubiquinone biosynthesis protein Coq4
MVFITMPEYLGKMKEAFSTGKKSNPIHGWKWNELLNESTEELRRKIYSSI